LPNLFQSKIHIFFFKSNDLNTKYFEILNSYLLEVRHFDVSLSFRPFYFKNAQHQKLLFQSNLMNKNSIKRQTETRTLKRLSLGSFSSSLCRDTLMFFYLCHPHLSFSYKKEDFRDVSTKSFTLWMTRPTTWATRLVTTAAAAERRLDRTQSPLGFRHLGTELFGLPDKEDGEVGGSVFRLPIWLRDTLTYAHTPPVDVRSDQSRERLHFDLAPYIRPPFLCSPLFFFWINKYNKDKNVKTKEERVNIYMNSSDISFSFWVYYY
jgi:hypothetical protein